MLLASYPVVCLKYVQKLWETHFYVKDIQVMVINIHLSSTLTAYPIGRRIFDCMAEAISIECQSSNLFC